jgi:hypothetical protein
MQLRQAIYQGEAGDYFGYSNEAFPSNIDHKVLQIDRDFQAENIDYLGRFNSSNQRQIQAYTYVVVGQKVAIVLLVSDRRFIGVDCISKLADNSFLATTSTGNSCIEQAQGIYCHAYPQINTLDLIVRHQSALTHLEQKHGEAQGIFSSLKSVAQTLDEYTVRQKIPTTDHAVSRWVGLFRNRANV